MPAQSSPSLDDLVRVLKAATEKNSLHWKETADENTFRAELSTGAVRISKTSAAPRYLLTLLDHDGTLLEEYEPSGEGEMIAIEALYKKARIEALNLDWKLKGLYDQLKSMAGES